MKTILTILFFVGLIKISFGLCASDNRTLTELLFNGKAGTIFTCKILSMTTQKYDGNTIVVSEDGIDGNATAEIIQVYFGKVDSNIITLKTGSYLQVGKTYLIYTFGIGKTFGCGGNCDKWTKQIADNPDSTHEIRLVKQFADIFNNKVTGKFIFKNVKGLIIAEGSYKKGQPIKTWKHYYDSGIIKAEYDLKKNITFQYAANGFIKEKSTIKKSGSISEQYSDKKNGQLYCKFVVTKNDTGSIMSVYEYYDNGYLKNVQGQINININKKGDSKSVGKTGRYAEYFENGKLKLKGQYDHNRRVKVWKWYKDNGVFDSKFDYKDGKGNQ